MRRLAILFALALFFSCGERAARSPSSVDSPSVASSMTFTSMQQVKNIRIGSIHNRIMGLEGEIPSGPVSANDLTLGALGQSIDVRLTRETGIEEGVRVTAVNSEGTEYSMDVARDSISTAGHDDTLFGFYFSIPFENKPWSQFVTWRLTVHAGKVPVVEKKLEVPAKDFIMYVKTTDNPFDVIDVSHLARGQTYKLSYPNIRSDLLIVYYTSDYSTYVPVYAGRADPHLDRQSAPEITIGAQALAGSYFFTHKVRSTISRDDEEFPVFGYKVIE